MKLNSKFWWLGWIVTFIGFAVGGTLGKVLVGSVDDAVAALLAGIVAGAVIGLAQWLVLRGEFGANGLWVAATALGLGVGLAIGASVVGFRTEAQDLAVMGAFSGLGVGAAQAWVLRERGAWAWGWLALNPALWAVSWLITVGIGVDVAAQWAVFGSSGALFYTLVAGLVLRLMLQPGAQRAASGVA